MAVKIRMTRRGAKKKPFYRVVVADSEAPRDGDFIEVVGHYNPMTEPAEINLKGERISYWLEQGAVPSETVSHLIKKAGIPDKSGEAA